MNKNELVTAMAEKSGLSKKDCDAALAAFTASVEDALKADDKVSLLGFGTFEVKNRAARTGINPQTKKPVEIAASKAPAFKAGKALANFQKLIDLMSKELWRDPDIECHACDGVAWVIKQFDANGKALKSSGDLDYIYGQRTLEEIARCLPSDDQIYDAPALVAVSKKMVQTTSYSCIYCK